MKKLLFTLLIGFLTLHISAQVEHVYDFNSLTTGSQNLNGQDGWVTHYQTASTSPGFDVGYASGDIISTDESIAVFYPYGGPGVGRTATRKASENFNFNFQNGGIIDLEFEMSHVWWGSYCGVGYDADGDGNILVGMTEGDGGIFLRCAGSGNNSQPNLVLPNGNSVQATSFTQNGWARYKMSFDFNAFGGEGSVTCFAKSYSEENGWGEWIQLPELTEVNMGLTPGSGDMYDYGVWDGIFFHFQGAAGGIDNILVRQMPEGNVQYISMDDIPKQLINNPPITLEATATSGLPVTYELISGPATLSGNILTLSGEVGTVKIKAMQSGNDQWLPAPDVFKTFDVIDPLAYTPEVKIRRPYDGTKVFMPELKPMLLVISAYIEHSDALKIESVTCNVDGQSLEAVTYYPNDPENGYFSVSWLPSQYGTHNMSVTVVTTGGNTTTLDNTFEVVQNYESQNITTLNGDLICTPTIHSAKGEYVIPSHVGAFNEITAEYLHNCVNGNCDTYDRVGGIRVRNYRGEWVELFRYISPFGVECEDEISVLDYTSVLQGLVEFEFFFESWNGSGYNPTLILHMEKGTPEFCYADVDEIWHDIYPFGDYENQQPVPSINYEFKSGAQKVNLKVITTGHNWSSNTAPNFGVNTNNAAEFSENTHTIKINGAEAFTQHLWRTCNPNPANCSPQNGTWYHNRSGWCPGSIAMVWDWDLGSVVSNDFTNPAQIAYQFDPTYLDYCHPNHPDCVSGQGGCPNCDAPDNPILNITGKIITYSNDVAVLEDFIHTEDIDENSSSIVEISPNPASHILNIKTDYTKGFTHVLIINTNGQLVKQFKFRGNTSLNISDMPKGIYFVKLLGDRLVTKKIIIQ